MSKHFFSGGMITPNMPPNQRTKLTTQARHLLGVSVALWGRFWVKEGIAGAA